MFENDTDANADETVSRRSVLKTAGGLLAGSAALAGLGAERGAAETEEGLRATLRERNEEYVAVEVWFPTDTFDEIKPAKDVYFGDADQFVVHDDDDAVSLPEDTEALANPVDKRKMGFYTYLLYFRTRAIQWPQDFDGVNVTLAVGAFPERTVPGDQWDTCPGLYANVREMTEDEIVVSARLPDGTDADDIAFPSDTFLGHTEQFVVHEGEDAVSLPEDTDGLATPVEMDFENPHEVTLYFRTEEVDLSAADGEEVSLGLGIFEERTVSGNSWDSCPGHRDY